MNNDRNRHHCDRRAGGAVFTASGVYGKKREEIMLTLKLKDFHEGKYDDSDEYHQLYVIRDGDKILYIGISNAGIHYRWFNGSRGHLIETVSGEWFANSGIGREVVDNLPNSLNWDIELWTRENCLEFLETELNKIYSPGYRSEAIDIEILEPLMIRKLKPKMNIIYSDL